MADIRKVRFDAHHAGMRLDAALAAAVGDLSRSRAQALIRAGAVRSSAGPLVDPATRVGAERLELDIAMPEPSPAKPLPEAIPLVIPYEDADLIVVDKPAGMVVHPSAGHEGGTLVNALLHQCAGGLSGVGGVMRPGIVHRLDKDTSGLIVAAKNDRAHRGLARQFADHGREGPLERRYLALAWGVPKPSRQTIDAPLDRHPHDRERMAVSRSGKGREAITHIDTVEMFSGAAEANVASLVHCTLETGRTHQIRVHMAHIGHPLLGDPVYGSGFFTKAAKLTDGARAALEALGRQALHAEILGFAHPVAGEAMLFRSEPPADLAFLIDMLRRRR